MPLGSSSRRVHQLLAVHEASLEFAFELDPATLLKRIADTSRRLVRARYGATCLWNSNGEMEVFTTSGMSRHEEKLLGEPPAQHGLLGMVLAMGEQMRLPDVTQHPLSKGFPDHHPEMRSLLAVPMLDTSTVLGGIYLTEKDAAAEFSDEDHELISSFAKLASMALKNALRYQSARAAAIAAERQRISRELHDSLAQVLAYISAKAGAAEEMIRSGDAEKAGLYVSELGRASRDAYAEVRDAILGLRIASNREGPLIEQLRNYLATWEEQSGVEGRLHLPAPEYRPRLDPVAELQVLRIVQEALANVRRHAGATRADVHIRQTAAGGIEVSVNDDGAGFAPPLPDRRRFPRFGLTTMRERASEAGGSLKVSSERGKGTRVTLRLPGEPKRNSPPRTDANH